jgi:hypothetical protein
VSEEKEIKTNRKNVFGEEIDVLKNSRSFLKTENIDKEQYRQHLEQLQNSYDDLLDQAKLITKVSDRLQNKINKANDELEEKNLALQESLDALTKAKLSRKANTITLVVIFILFIITEAWLEPIIEKNVHLFENYSWHNTADTLVALSMKAVIALSLRPIEKIIENRLVKREQEKIQREKGDKKRELETLLTN